MTPKLARGESSARGNAKSCTTLRPGLLGIPVRRSRSRLKRIFPAYSGNGRVIGKGFRPQTGVGSSRLQSLVSLRRESELKMEIRTIYVPPTEHGLRVGMLAALASNRPKPLPPRDCGWAESPRIFAGVLTRAQAINAGELRVPAGIC